MNILFHTHLTQEFPELIENLRERHPGHRFIVAEEEGRFHEELPRAHALVTGPKPPEILDRAPQLRIHFIPFAGVNRVPLDYLRRRGIRLANSHGNASLVAERALALALAAAGRLVEFDQDLRRGLWHRRDDPDQPFDYWFSLQGRRVTILGTGAIGIRVAELLRPFGGEIRGFRRHPDAHPAFDRISDDLAAALEGAELVFVALPLTPETTGLLDRRALALAPGSVLINVSRADIIEEEALYASLTDGGLRAAGLDVWYDNPRHFTEQRMPSRHAFHELDNVVLSPHAGSHAQEGKRLQLEGTVRNIDHFLETGEPLTPVDVTAGY
jgi:phosphoglycerate dehydrogenase-like enzyme